MDNMDILVALLLFNFVILWYYFNRKSGSPIEKTRDFSQNSVEIAVTEKSEEIAGYYDGKQIPLYVTLQDGRRFIYESIAVKNRDGIYASSDPNQVHVKVDDCFLYKLVEAPSDK